MKELYHRIFTYCLNLIASPMEHWQMFEVPVPSYSNKCRTVQRKKNRFHLKQP